jgi:hypothetical protein
MVVNERDVPFKVIMHQSKSLNDLCEYMKLTNKVVIKNIIHKNKFYWPCNKGYMTLKEMGIDKGSKVMCSRLISGG